MPTFFSSLRPDPHYRREAFDKGLKACGYRTAEAGQCDLYVTWNRYGARELMADRVEKRGGRVLVIENATWGNDFLGGRWYSLWPRCHNLGANILEGSGSRWDRLDVELQAWRSGGETVGLPQRGIGPRGTPARWIPPGCDRIRPHPGTKMVTPLEVDLARAGKVVTWGSGAAVKALLWGIKVESHMPGWCGIQDNTDAGRLAMFRRLSWAQWTLSEIESGAALAWVLA